MIDASTIVAQGFVIETASENSLIHGKPLGNMNYRVAVEVSIIDEALLPIPVNDEMVTVQSAIGSHVAWPRHLVIFGDGPVRKPKQKSIAKQSTWPSLSPNYVHGKIDVPKKHMEHGSSSSGTQLLEPSNYFSKARLPPSLQLLWERISKMKDANVVSKVVELRKEVFGVEAQLMVLKDDIEQFVCMKEVGASILIVYMRYLESVLREKTQQFQIAFMDPSRITSDTYVDNDRVDAIARRMVDLSGGQSLFIPWNAGSHWVLVIINQWLEQTYILDPLPNSSQRADIRNIINMAFDAYFDMKAMRKTRNSKESCEWKNPMVPKQPSNFECGYYVMRMMRDLVLARQYISVIASKFGGRNSFTVEEINIMREEWARSFLQDWN